MYFEVILVILTLVTGIIYIVCKINAPKKDELNASDNASDTFKFLEWLGSFFPIFIFILFIRSFIIEPFSIPSGSMYPTLEIGDFVLVKKYSYGIKLPITQTEIIATGSPQRGDIAVFSYPHNQKLNYIKRIIGLPGDKILYENKILYINGKKVNKTRLGYYKNYDKNSYYSNSELYKETLTEKGSTIEYQLLNIANIDTISQELIVPENSYFVMGDNRDDSSDSRVWGFVDEKLLKGQAFLIWMNWGDSNNIKWDRIGLTF